MGYYENLWIRNLDFFVKFISWDRIFQPNYTQKELENQKKEQLLERERFIKQVEMKIKFYDPIAQKGKF